MSLIDLKIEERLFESEEISFAIPLADPKSADLILEAPIVFEGHHYFIHRAKNVMTKDGVRLRYAWAEINWMRLADIKRPGDTVIDELTPTEGLAQILAGTGWGVGLVDSTLTGPFSHTETDGTVLALIWAWCRVCLAEPIFDSATKTIALVSGMGIPTTASFRYGRDLLELEKEELPPTATRLYAFGKDDLSIIGVAGAAYIEDYTWYTDQGITEEYARSQYQKDNIFSDTTYDDENKLLAEAQKQLAITSRPTIIYKGTVADISRIARTNINFKAGDYAQVHDDDLSQELTARVTRKVRFPYDESRNEVELSFNPVPLPSTTARTSRTSNSREWVAFTGPIAADFIIRNDGSYTVARIPLRFTSEGKLHLHLDLVGIGVGSGTVIVTIYDDVLETTVQTLSTSYTDGAEWRVFKTWFEGELDTRRNYRLRVTTEADGGPSGSNGVNLFQETEERVSWYILAQGAVRETPRAENSVTFDYTGAIQYWTVPDNVEGPVTFIVRGNQGGRIGGLASQITGKLASVIPGNIYDIYVGGGTAQHSGLSGTHYVPGWPNGGQGGIRASAGSNGGGGGASSHIIPGGGAFGDALIVAPGGGGKSGDNNPGGAAGFFFGEDGIGGSSGAPGLGATQGAGGALGVGASTNGTAGTFGQGGDGGGGGGLLGSGGGAGGGGWYGGGGAGGNGAVHGSGNGGGGGGVGYIDPIIYDIEIQDGVGSGDGQIVVTWEDPTVEV